jgi:rod shape determining protein RodA
MAMPPAQSPFDSGRRWLSGLDWVLVVAVVLLCVAGTFSAYAATVHNSAGPSRGSHYLTRSLMNIAVGCLLASPALLIDYRRLRSYAPVLYVGVCFLLLLVLSPLGRVVNGARAWFILGPFQFEPSEFAKLAIIVMLAVILTEQREVGEKQNRDILLALAVAAVPMMLTLAEPALGVTVIVGMIAVIVMAVSGVPARFITGLMAATTVVIVIVFTAHLLKPYQAQRFTYFANSQVADNSTTGYQIQQSEIAVGSGGLTGAGLLDGSQTNGGFVPEQQTDFVFTVIAEESGFLGAGALLMLYGIVLARGMRIASHAPDLLGTVIAAGITTWIALQAFVNIGVTLGIAPVTGVPLLFVSYGGSSMLAGLLGIALLLNIGSRTA